MGVRFHRAIGYGMPWERFTALFLERNDADCAHDALNARFRNADPADFVVPKEIRRSTYPGLLGNPEGLPTPPHFLELNLLSKNVTLDGRVDANLGHATDLFTLVRDSDNTHDIIFFPNAMLAQQWVHYHDAIDVAFGLWKEEWRGNRSTEDEPKRYTKYIETGHYPFTHLLMHEDGAAAEHDYWWHGQNKDRMLPGVPAEIRWYVEKLGLLSLDGCAQLRPVLAQWWA